ncbi:kynureninase [Sporichthya polymorpha]|uniref:kynureninase n=1 Tax=Sporichthya polymorpha TaxID=35751 RepID=UPI0003A896A1|nr:kynureninase [Sporichthya polymorpha]
MSPGTDRAAAEALDAADPLAGFRDRFVEPEPGLIYLDGNSLGRLPRATVDRLRQVVEQEWAGGLVRSWHDWIDLPTRVGDRIGEHLVGAHPGEVVVSDSTTVNLYKLAHAACSARPGRDVIVTDDDNFPTDRYTLAGLAQARGMTVRVVASDPVTGPDPADLLAALDDRVAVLSLSHVAYRSGALLDLPTITAAAHGVGALMLWDLCHSAGSVPVGLADAGVDLAVGCGYKYLNGGPGAPAFLYVRRDLQPTLRQPIWGWFGQRDQFAMGERYDPEPDVRRFLTGTPAVVGLAALEEGVRLLAEAGLDLLRAKGMAMTELARVLAAEWLLPLGFELASPADPAARGSHLTLRHPEAFAISRALIAEADVIGDFRTPDCLRLGPAPISTRFTEVWDAFDRLRSLVAAGRHRAHADPSPADRRVT